MSSEITPILPDESYLMGLIDGSGLFDHSYYLSLYPDVLESGINPLLHFIRYGAKEKRLPSPRIREDIIKRFYDNNPDGSIHELILQLNSLTKEAISPQPRISCVVHGNAGIQYKDIVTLTSVGEHNSFDLYSATCGTASNEYLAYLKLYNIGYYPYSEQAKSYCNGFQVKGPFPGDIYARYYFPLEFHALGYDYLIVLDYDMICLHAYDLKTLLPSHGIISGHGYPLNSRLLPDELKIHFMKKRDFPPERFIMHIYNAGFLVYNLNNYIASDFHLVYRDIHNEAA